MAVVSGIFVLNFPLTEYIESRGSGIARVKKICADKNIGFSIEETGDFVRVVFKRRIAPARKHPQETTDTQHVTHNKEDAPARKHPQENTRKKEIEKKKIIEFVKVNGKIRRSETMELLNCGDYKAKQLLNELIKTDLERVEKGKYTYYTLKK